MSLSFLSFSFFSVCFNWRDTLISIFFMSSKAFSYLLLNVTQRTVTEDVRWWGGDLLLWPPFTQPACTDQVSTEDSRGWPGWESHSFALSDSLLHYSGLWRPSGNSPGDQEIRILSFFLPDLMLELPSFWTIGLYNLKEDWIDISLIYYMGNWFLKSKVLKNRYLHCETVQEISTNWVNVVEQVIGFSLNFLCEAREKSAKRHCVQSGNFIVY